MRFAVVLLVVAVAVGGFLLGRLTVREEKGRGEGRRGAPARDVPPTSAEAKPPPEHGAVGDKVVALEPSDNVVAPTRPVNEAEDEYPHLEVDFTGFRGEHTAWVAVRKMQGAAEAADCEADESGIAWVPLFPGTHGVWWFDEEDRALGVRVRIEQGKVTRLRAIDHHGGAPLPRGLGLVVVEALACAGGGIEDEWVTLATFDDYSTVYTDSRGRASTLLLPGRYGVEIGDHRGQLVVDEGHVTFHRIEHDHEGDLVIVAARPTRVAVKRGDDVVGSVWIREGTVGVRPYLHEGEYEIWLEGIAFLGRVTVQIGQATRFVCELPPGGINVQATKADGENSTGLTLQVRREVDGRETEGFNSYTESAGLRQLALARGRYLVTASARGYEPASTTVDVADKVIDVALELRRSR